MAENDARIGMPAPDFQLPSSEDVPFHLSEELGKGPIMLLFYPNDFGIICSLEMRTFQEMGDEFKTKGVRVVGISRNSVFTHKQWKASMGVPFRLLSDPEGEVSTKYGGLQYSGLMKGMPHRAVFIIGRDGIIRYVWISSAEGVPPPFEEVREKVLTLDL